MESRDILQMALNISGNSKEEYLYHVLVSNSSAFPGYTHFDTEDQENLNWILRLASVILMSMLYLSF